MTYSQSLLKLSVEVEQLARHGTIISVEVASLLLGVSVPEIEYERLYVLTQFQKLLQDLYGAVRSDLNFVISQTDFILVWQKCSVLPITFQETSDSQRNLLRAVKQTLKRSMNNQIKSAKILLAQSTITYPDDFERRYGDQFFDTVIDESARLLLEDPFPQSPIARFQGDPYAKFPEDPSKTYLEAFNERLHQVIAELGYERDPKCGILKCPPEKEFMAYEDVYAGFRTFSQYFEDPVHQKGIRRLNIHTLQWDEPTRGHRAAGSVTLSGRVALAFKLELVPFRGASISAAIEAVRKAIQIVKSYRDLENHGAILESNTMRNLIFRQLDSVVGSLNLGNPNVLIRKLRTQAVQEPDEPVEEEPISVDVSDLDDGHDDPLVELLFIDGFNDFDEPDGPVTDGPQEPQEPQVVEHPETPVAVEEPTRTVDKPVVSISTPKTTVRKRLREVGTTEDIALDLLLSQQSFIMRELVSSEAKAVA